MGQYEHHVFGCTSGKTGPTPQHVRYVVVDEVGARRIVAEHLVRGRVVEDFRCHAPPGGNKDV